MPWPVGSRSMALAILGRRAASQARLPVVDIRQNTLALRGGQRRQVLHCQPTQVALKDEQEQAAVLQALTELLHALAHPIQVVLQVRPAEDRDLLGVKPNSVPAPMQGIAASYTDLLADLLRPRPIGAPGFLCRGPLGSACDLAQG